MYICRLFHCFSELSTLAQSVCPVKSRLHHRLIKKQLVFAMIQLKKSYSLHLSDNLPPFLIRISRTSSIAWLFIIGVLILFVIEEVLGKTPGSDFSIICPPWNSNHYINKEEFLHSFSTFYFIDNLYICFFDLGLILILNIIDHYDVKHCW